MSLLVNGMDEPDMNDYNGISCCLYNTLGGQLRLRNNETGQFFDVVTVPFEIVDGRGMDDEVRENLIKYAHTIIPANKGSRTSDYIKREDARGIINEYFKGERTGNQIVDAIPAADVVERASGLVGEIPHTPVCFLPPHMSAAIEKVISERERQMELWGECSDNHPFEWMSILGEEFGELCEAVNETYFKNGAHPEYGGNEKIIKEAVHVAAVAVAIIESAIRAGEG